VTHTGSSFRKTAWIIAVCAGFSFANPLLAAPQEEQEKAAETVSEEVDRLLWDRGREILHTGDPLDIVGQEEGENGFRDRTPILQQSDKAVAMVDIDESYRRRLAMYSEGRSFHRPLPAAAGNLAGMSGSALAARPPAAPTTPDGPSGGGALWPIILPASLLLALLLVIRWRRHQWG
jgi:hypothetical protein